VKPDLRVLAVHCLLLQQVICGQRFSGSGAAATGVRIDTNPGPIIRLAARCRSKHSLPFRGPGNGGAAATRVGSKADTGSLGATIE
jgi:hypothetical protein